MSARIGMGFDVHRLISGEGFRLAGVAVPCEFAVDAWSDGDVLYHALVDAMLGAAALGDIGDHFPDTDERWKDADSSIFVEEAVRLVADTGLVVANVDANVFLEEPKLGTLKDEMRKKIAEILNIDIGAVSVKAKTLEGLGAVGTARALAAQVAVILHEP